MILMDQTRYDVVIVVGGAAGAVMARRLREDPKRGCCYSIPVPRGKVLGGSTAINGAVAMRAPKVDHDPWQREHDLEGWAGTIHLPASDGVLHRRSRNPLVPLRTGS